MSETQPSTLAPVPFRALGVVVGALAVVLTGLSARYGYHRDELYFVEAGRHLAWGFIDQPPLTPALARLSGTVLGDSLAALRVVATLLACASAVVAALISRELGGSARAQWLTALLTVTTGYTLAIGHMLSTGSADLLIWLTVIWLVLRVLRTGRERLLVPVGAVVGIGLLNKSLVVLLVGALVVAMAVDRPRLLRSPWLWAGAVVALLVAAPNLIWQASNGWPQLEVAQGIGADDGADNRLMLVPEHFLLLGPFLAPVWLAGAVRLWREPAIRWARPIVFAYLAAALVTLVAGGKFSYVLPLLVPLLAAGVPWLLGLRAAWRGLLVAGIAVGLLVNAVIALPVLPESRVDLANAVNQEQGEQIGWRRLVHTVAEVWQSIPEGERGRAVVLTSNYGEAGAIDRFGPAVGLPPAYSGHMSYADWGPPPDTATGPVVVVRPEDSAPLPGLRNCRPAAVVDTGADNEEMDAVVELCAGPDGAWSAVWEDLRHGY